MDLEEHEGEELAYIKSTRCGYCHQQKPVEKSWALESVSKLMKDKGYCNSSSITFDGEELSFQRYEQLIKQGWRRSGSFMYKPDLLRSCCRQYTIRTNYEMFVDDKYYNKSNKKSIRRFYKAMETGINTATGSLLDMYTQKDKKGRFFSVLLPNSFTMDKFQLFKRYQMSIHKEKESEINEYSFYNFLCNDPFPEVTKRREYVDWKKVNQQWTSGEIGKELLDLQGPVHECYFIDNKLVAIAVLDILPTTISSVYFIWDPDYAHLGLGTVSAIREIVMTKLLEKDHYYMGFYIPDCEKMVYKAKFGGEIRNFADDESLEWVKMLDVDHLMKDGLLRVFAKTQDGEKLAEVTEKMYGVEGCRDAEALDSFRVISKTCIFPTPSIIPGLDTSSL